MKRYLAVGTALLIALGSPACGSSDDPSGPDGAEGTYVFLPKSLDNPYWVDARKGMEAEARKLGVKAEFIGPHTADAGQQLTLFEIAISRRPDGIAVSPNDPETMKATIQRAVDAGIAVVAWDSEAPGSAVAAYVGTDNLKAGEEMAETLAQVIDGRGDVAVMVGSLTARNALQRIEGLRRGLRSYPDIDIVTTRVTHERIPTATVTARAVLRDHPDLAAIAGITGADAPGAGAAAQQAGRCGEVTVVGFDVVPQGQRLMRAGCIQALVSQRPYGMTAKALRLLTRLNAGEEPPSRRIDTGVIVVRPDGLDEFLQEPH
jgi:ribose transport system substrate-binding protein